MGERGALKLWAMRAILFVVVALTALVRLQIALGQQRPPFLDSVRRELAASQFSVGPVKYHEWFGGKVKQVPYIVATHIGCRGAISLTPYEIKSAPTNLDRDDLIVIGDWQGHQPSRWRIIFEAARLEGREILRRNGGSISSRMLLIASDPSACLTFGQPDWVRIWD